MVWFAGAMSSAVGVLLAAGAGTRMGRPKALVTGRDGQPWVRTAARALHEGGCGRVVVVVGAAQDDVAGLLADLPWAEPAPAADWSQGMSASLAAGLGALSGTDADSAVIGLVDTPDVGAEVVERVLAATGTSRAALGRAAYGGVPGHPVVLGRDHWAGTLLMTGGDRGARDYLSRAQPLLVECGDLASGRDVDTWG
jgi:CTP:molybdopterin cytidylyltransferase MocA